VSSYLLLVRSSGTFHIGLPDSLEEPAMAGFRFSNRCGVAQISVDSQIILWFVAIILSCMYK
jgi:hypothetical protein